MYIKAFLIINIEYVRCTMYVCASVWEIEMFFSFCRSSLIRGVWVVAVCRWIDEWNVCVCVLRGDRHFTRLFIHWEQYCAARITHTAGIFRWTTISEFKCIEMQIVFVSLVLRWNWKCFATILACGSKYSDESVCHKHFFYYLLRRLDANNFDLFRT